MRKRPFLLLGLTLLPAAACSLINSLDGYTGGVDAAVDVAPPPSGTVETGPPPPPRDAGQDGETCSPRKPPARPPQGSVAGTSTFVVALSTFTLADSKDPSRAFADAYDLDGLCTCPGARACVPSTQAGVCDLPRGVDNSFGEFWLVVESVIEQGGTATRVGRGDEGLVVRIKNYNDLPDDDLVEVAVFETFGAEVRADGGTGTLKRDGSDLWTIDSRSLLGGTPYLPVAVDTRAYVTGGTVVAEVKAPIRVGDVTFPISVGYFTAKIVKKGELYALENGVLSGRFSASRFLTGLEAASSSTTGPLCGENPIYKSVRDGVCRARDLPTDPTLDGKESPCDALSLAIGFAAEPAQLGRVMTAPTVPRPCGDTWVATCP